MTAVPTPPAWRLSLVRPAYHVLNCVAVRRGFRVRTVRIVAAKSSSRPTSVLRSEANVVAAVANTWRCAVR